MLTSEQIDILNAPFDDVHDYGVVNGKVYLRKEAIKRRLTAADPGWSISEPQFVARDGDVVFMSATLTVGGVSRAALGSGTINSTRKQKDGSVIAIDGYDLALEIRKAYKGAAMDCLARAAVFFMRGLDDLREKPNNEQSIATINGFLKQRRPTTPQDSSGSQPPARPSQPPQERRQLVTAEPPPEPEDEIIDFDTLGTPHIVVTQLEVKLTSTNKPMIVANDGKVKASTFTRDPLRAVLPQDVIDALATPGVYNVPTLRVYYRKDGTFNNIDRVALAATG